MKIYSSTTISKAKILRSQGYTYQEICNNLGANIPKSTMNSWVKNIPTPKHYQDKIADLVHTNIKHVQKLALIKNKALLKERLNALRTKNISLVYHIDHSVAILLLATLYWCEGAKYPSHRGIRFGSSDPDMIRLFVTLLRTCYSLNENKFRLTVQCRSDQNIQILTAYWQLLTKISKEITYKAQIDKRSIGIPTKKLSYKGVCVIEYLDTNLQYELQALGKYLGSTQSITIMKKHIK